uniref:Guanine nucleotide-binding protein subunit beta-like protein n=1 Tax=Paramoeba aestuarina TaxID=180227 RepID=A0A7S4JKA8_9EUKA|mmetsp:Transcript_11220/g.16976  ORF Transcript_11220/g.16976 Transcript_11220/m.16976 type:complete len:472 (+) Transcript_11220:128-1543(+)|eukprot:CAMPEP_0201516238 /NCGR_PEP_ID=MMETSP0161_2-20130828/7611_1 /ASSEMBLY_ACC=CAM_ASM_000251 /TAXON_ID=180227 /ORGANISM="Neoparamoeba aestuarina, Strain SoJaBio B1-5/56/2" /LENGTH=471 /DNA_ID=CAMNT_0047913295 /DNA_START=123 /DNA_END=1538 /DNA_ORIENTATION=+
MADEGLDGEVVNAKATRVIEVDESKMAISNMVTWKDFVYVGTPKFFRAIELSTSEVKFQIDTGVKGMFSKSNLLLGALTDFQILLFNMKTNLPMLLLNGHTNWVASVVIHKQIIISASADKTAIIWDISDFYAPVAANSGPGGGDDHGKKKKDKKSKSKIPSLPSAATDTETHSEFETDGTGMTEYIMDSDFALDDDVMKCLEVKSSFIGPLETLEGHTDTVVMTGLIGGLIVTASADKTIRLWNMKGKCMQVIDNAHSDWITQGKVQGIQLFTIGRDNVVKQWTLAEKGSTFSKKTIYLKHSHTYSCEARPVRVFLSKSRLFVPMSDHAVYVYDHKSGKLVNKCVGHTDKIASLVIGSDNIFWSAGSDKKIRKWAVETGNVICQYLGHTGAINKLQMTGGNIVSGSDDGSIRVWSKRDVEDRLRWYSGTGGEKGKNLDKELEWYKGKDKGAKKGDAGNKQGVADELAWYM